MIACVYVADFVAALERQAHAVTPATPLVVRDAGPPGRVLALCGRAADRGVRAGMSEASARSRCPEATVVAAAPARYERAAEDVTALLAGWSSRVAPGEHSWHSPGRDTPERRLGGGWWFVELGRVDAAAALDWAHGVGRAVAEHARLQATIAVAPTRFSAWCAAWGDMGFVPAERTAALLAPLPIELLPLDDHAAERLHMLGLSSLGQLAALPAGALETQLGGPGRLLRQLALGRDCDPIPPYVPQHSIKVTRRAQGPIEDLNMLRSALDGIAERLSARLERRAATARNVHLQLEVEYGAPWEDALVLAAPASRAAPLRAALHILLGRAQPASGVERLDIVLAGLRPLRSTQLGLFDDAANAGRPRRDLFADLVARFGPRRFFGIASRCRDARLPEWRFGVNEH